MLSYIGQGRRLTEGELDDVQNVSKADARLLAGRMDRVDQFELRLEALRRRAEARRSPAWGLPRRAWIWCRTSCASRVSPLRAVRRACCSPTKWASAKPSRRA